MEQRVRAASPGPWFSLVAGRDLEAGMNCIELGCCSLMEVLGGTIADQDFIANAREDLPLLLREVRRLRAVIGRQVLPSESSHRVSLPEGTMERELKEGRAQISERGATPSYFNS